ncbi:hypothetical protein [Streptomyces sp. NPDC014685]|uniref:hypothetical protein n=1 Tax=Streptomyces sp. NPDC014685 TaxID=3364881 RepID=UPI003701758E
MQYAFRGVTIDGGTVLYERPDNAVEALQLSPDRWYRELCDVIGDRELTPEEVDPLPADPRTRNPCAAD